MEIWLEKNICTGCGVCANICPKNAISMVEDECGFKYPVIDKDKCINCGLCKRTCPLSSPKDNNKFSEPKAFAGWSKDSDNRFISTSGGLFTEIAKSIINDDGFVIGAKYNDDLLVEHAIIDNVIDLEKIRQSKYLQSNTNDIFIKTKKLLDDNKKVAFCGSPCQIAGLYNFLRKEYDNLLTIEFICRGMNSPKAYKSWLSEIEKVENKKVVKVWFKYKVNGWNTSPRCTRVDFSDGSFKVYDGKENLYMSGYLGPNLYIRPSCGNCHFNGLPRQADITLADFWGIEKELDDDKGTSLILTNSEKGEKIIEKISDNLVINQRKLSEIYEGNVCFSNSVEINKKSEEFLKSLNDENFSQQIKKYAKVSLVKKVFRKIKRVIKKIINK